MTRDAESMPKLEGGDYGDAVAPESASRHDGTDPRLLPLWSSGGASPRSPPEPRKSLCKSQPCDSTLIMRIGSSAME